MHEEKSGINMRRLASSNQVEDYPSTLVRYWNKTLFKKGPLNKIWNISHHLLLSFWIVCITGDLSIKNFYLRGLYILLIFSDKLFPETGYELYATLTLGFNQYKYPAINVTFACLWPGQIGGQMPYSYCLKLFSVGIIENFYEGVVTEDMPWSFMYDVYSFRL